jgi:hypothetical protein
LLFPFCHPERSRGICGSADLSWKREYDYKKPAGFPGWFRDSRSIYFLGLPDNPGVFRMAVTGEEGERIIDLKGVHYTGYYGVWFGLDPTEALLLLRDIGTSDIYALRLEQK